MPTHNDRQSKPPATCHPWHIDGPGSVDGQGQRTRAGQRPAPEPAALAAHGPHRAYLELEALASAAPQARSHVRDTLARWGLSQVADDAELIACELVTNAITASAELPFRATVGLLVGAQPGRLIVMVWDASRERPVRPNPDDDAVTGRGLAIVAALSARWGWVSDVRGKVVWAMVDLEALGAHT